MDGLICKSFDVSLSTEPDAAQGSITALVVPFNNVDKQQDRIVKGAYLKSLKRWRESGKMIPMVFAHQWKNPLNHIGYWDPSQCEEVEETVDHPAGLLMKGVVDIGYGNPVADWIHRLMSTKRISQFSQGFLVPQGGEGRNKSDGANDISEIDLIEAGPTMAGVNPDTVLMELKSVGVVDAPSTAKEIVTDLAGSIERIIMALQQALEDYRNTSSIDINDADLVLTAFPPDDKSTHIMPDGSKMLNSEMEGYKKQKSEDIAVMEEESLVDWDVYNGDAALEQAEQADDPIYALTSISAGVVSRNEGDALRKGFRLAHHTRPDGPPNASAVESALARIDQPQTLAVLDNYKEAKTHLLDHQREIDGIRGEALDEEMFESPEADMKAIRDYITKASLEILSDSDANPSRINNPVDRVIQEGEYNITTVGRIGAKIHELGKSVKGIILQNKGMSDEERTVLEDIAACFKTVGMDLTNGSSLGETALIEQAIMRGKSLRNDIENARDEFIVGDDTRIRIGQTLGDPILKVFNTYLHYAESARQ